MIWDSLDAAYHLIIFVVLFLCKVCLYMCLGLYTFKCYIPILIAHKLTSQIREKNVFFFIVCKLQLNCGCFQLTQQQLNTLTHILFYSLFLTFYFENLTLHVSEEDCVWKNTVKCVAEHNIFTHIPRLHNSKFII